MLSPERLRTIAQEEMGAGGLYVYDQEQMAQTAEQLKEGMDAMPFGGIVRYAAKANPHSEIVSIFDKAGLHFDASSVPEAKRLEEYGVDPDKISLSSQILQENMELYTALDSGVKPVATSLRQVLRLGALSNTGLRLDGKIAVRINPGIGSGHNNRTNVGGPASSFGIWHGHIDQVKTIAENEGVEIDRIHTHIGSGADPSIWRKVIQTSLGVVEQFDDVRTLDIGGGFKVARTEDEEATDMNQVFGVFEDELEEFYQRTGREIKLEIEPGTFLVANAGVLLARVEEVVSTKENGEGYDFIKLNAGMNALLRPSIYGSQHAIEVLNDSNEQKEYVVVGPCCESGDILTPAPGDPEGIKPRMLNDTEEGDFVVIRGAGAYAASMSPRQYNDIPVATELVV